MTPAVVVPHPQLHPSLKRLRRGIKRHHRLILLSLHSPSIPASARIPSSSLVVSDFFPSVVLLVFKSSRIKHSLTFRVNFLQNPECHTKTQHDFISTTSYLVDCQSHSLPPPSLHHLVISAHPLQTKHSGSGQWIIFTLIRCFNYIEII